MVWRPSHLCFICCLDERGSCSPVHLLNLVEVERVCRCFLPFIFVELFEALCRRFECCYETWEALAPSRLVRDCISDIASRATTSSPWTHLRRRQRLHRVEAPLAHSIDLLPLPRPGPARLPRLEVVHFFLKFKQLLFEGPNLLLALVDPLF